MTEAACPNVLKLNIKPPVDYDPTKPWFTLDHCRWFNSDNPICGGTVQSTECDPMSVTEEFLDNNLTRATTDRRDEMHGFMAAILNGIMKEGQQLDPGADRQAIAREVRLLAEACMAELDLITAKATDAKR